MMNFVLQYSKSVWEKSLRHINPKGPLTADRTWTYHSVHTSKNKLMRTCHVPWLQNRSIEKNETVIDFRCFFKFYQHLVGLLGLCGAKTSLKHFLNTVVQSSSLFQDQILWIMKVTKNCAYCQKFRWFSWFSSKIENHAEFKLAYLFKF